MKVTKTQAEPAFQPIELKITIESAEELRVLKNITAANQTNAQAMTIEGTLSSYNVDTVANILAEIYKAL